MKKLITTLMLALATTMAGGAEGAWESISNPETNRGLVLTPKMMQFRGRVYLVWGGTSGPAIQPEIFFSSRTDGDKEWTVSRAPFFGRDLGRVRNVAVATARDMMVILFERESSIGGAIEVLLSVCPDSGYTFNVPFVMDSFVLHDTSGSSIAVAARQGTKRPEFAAAWVSEGGAIRAANVDPRSGYRPEAISVGDVASHKVKIDMVGAGSKGFYVVWPEAGGLKTSHIKPLTGGIEPAISLAPGRFGKNWSACSHYRGPGYVVAADEEGKTSTLKIEDSDKFATTMPASNNAIAGRNLESRTAVDGDKNIHMVTMDGFKCLYTTNKGGKWSAPETIAQLDPSVPLTGFDITVTDEWVWVLTAQNQVLKIAKRKIPG